MTHEPDLIAIAETIDKAIANLIQDGADIVVNDGIMTLFALDYREKSNALPRDKAVQLAKSIVAARNLAPDALRWADAERKRLTEENAAQAAEIEQFQAVRILDAAMLAGKDAELAAAHAVFEHISGLDLDCAYQAIEIARNQIEKGKE